MGKDNLFAKGKLLVTVHSQCHLVKLIEKISSYGLLKFFNKEVARPALKIVY